MDLTCSLLTALVLFCDPLAAEYTPAASTVPPEQWRLVRRVLIAPVGVHGGSSDRQGTIVLSADRDDSVLYHEVGHLVAWADDGELGRLWEAVAWSDGRPRWPLPNGYAAISPAEDFAESYQWFIEGRLAECCEQRARLLHGMVPELAAYEGAGRR